MARVIDGEPPLDGARPLVAVPLPSRDEMFELVVAPDPLGKPVAHQAADLHLRHAEPAPVPQSVVHLEAPREPLRPLLREYLVEGAHGVGVEVVPDQDYALCLREQVFRDPAQGLREVDSRPRAGDAGVPLAQERRKHTNTSATPLWVSRTFSWSIVPDANSITESFDVA